MKFFIVCAILASAYAGPTTRIIGGSETMPGQYPHQVSLKSRFGSHFCGGSLISADYVLTAAHCVNGSSANNIDVVLGEHNRGLYEGVEVTIRAAQLIIHDNYGSGNGAFPNDIALIRLSTSANLTNYIQPIKMANEGQNFDGQNCVISGWGKTHDSGNNLPNTLQHVNITVISNSACKRSWGNNIIDSHICVFDQGLTSSACNGDSGGPLVCGNLLVGATSWGINGCGVGATTYPSVYSRVSSFRNDFIDKHVPNLE